MALSRADIGFAINFVDKLSEDQHKEIVDKCLANYEADKGSRTDWEKRHANWDKLFMTYRDPKNFPWEGCSNVALGTISIASIQFHARAAEALLPSGDFVKPFYRSDIDRDAAIRMSTFMNVLLKERIVDYEDELDESLLQMSVVGGTFRKVWWDDDINGPSVSSVPYKDLVVNYGVKSIDKATTITHVMRLPLAHIQKKIDSGSYVIPKDKIEEFWNRGAETETRGEIEEQQDKASGLTQSEGADNAMREIIEHHCYLDLKLDKTTHYDPYVVLIDMPTKRILRIVSPVRAGKKVQTFINMPFIKSPYSVYGIGFGMLLEGIAESMDTIVNQLIDAGTLANTKAGLAAKGVLPKGKFAMSMGQFTEVNGIGQNLSQQIFEFQFKEPSQVLYSMLGTLQKYIDRITTVTEVQTGEMPRSDTPASTMMAAIEQGMKVFTNIHRRLHRSLSKEYKLIFEYLSMGMNSDPLIIQDYLVTLGPNFQNQEQDAALDYTRGAYIAPTSDPALASRVESVQRAQQVYQIIATDPLTANDPTKRAEALMDFLKAIGVNSPERYIPNAPVDSAVDYPAEMENAFALKGQALKVLPDQDHPAHIQSHSQFMSPPDMQAILGPGLEPLQQHIRDHIAEQYIKEVQGGGSNVGVPMAEQGALASLQQINPAGMAGMGLGSPDQMLPGNAMGIGQGDLGEPFGTGQPGEPGGLQELT